VDAEGVEPSCREAPPPQDGVYTSSTTHPKSVWQDSNLRLSAPEAATLTKLSYTPMRVDDGTRTRNSPDHNRELYH
jgi:hypothetical protein